MKALISCLLLLAPAPAEARQHRSQSVLREFQQLHPCPSTGSKTGACPGFQKDHRQSLECGGPDAVVNLQWLSVADHAAKTKLDNKGCRMIAPAAKALKALRN